MNGIKNAINTPQASLTYPPPAGNFTFTVNGKTVGTEIPVDSVLTIDIFTELTCTKIEYNLTREGLLLPVQESVKVKAGQFRIVINTASFLGFKLPEGTYGMKFKFYDPAYSPSVNEWDDPGYTFNNFFKIAKIVNLTIYIIIGIIAAVAIVAFLVIKKKRDAQLLAQASGSNETDRKRKIYSGASSIGKADGMRAEAALEKRKQGSSGPSEITKPRSAPLRSGSTQIKEVTPVELDKLPASVQVKLEEQKVAIDQRAKFLNSKIDVLRSQFDMLTMIVSNIKDQPSCPICNKVLAKEWDFCPYCKLNEHRDELEMKKSVAALDKNKASKCAKCGYLLDPAWITCPKCFAKEKNL
jgi:RNA polymerase subunit RPABC4/transcription elongation factor Spt4